jgi:hypothetical protein
MTYRSRSEATLEAALKEFGWLCGDEFWQRYYTDPWVFHLANAVERLTEQVTELKGRADA